MSLLCKFKTLNINITRKWIFSHNIYEYIYYLLGTNGTNVHSNVFIKEMHKTLHTWSVQFPVSWLFSMKKRHISTWITWKLLLVQTIFTRHFLLRIDHLIDFCGYFEKNSTPHGVPYPAGGRGTLALYNFFSYVILDFHPKFPINRSWLKEFGGRIRFSILMTGLFALIQNHYVLLRPLFLGNQM